MRHSRILLTTIALLSLGNTGVHAQSVGVTAAVNQNARGTPPQQAVRTLVLGEHVIHDERIETNDVGLLQILLADGTAFTVGPNSALSIDRFVYDPNAGTAKVTASLTKGVFRFIGGKTSKTADGVTLDTPVGTIGIRGAVANISLVPTTLCPGVKPAKGPGAAPVSPCEPVEAHVGLDFGKEVTLDGPGGRSRLYEPGYSIVVRRNADGTRTQQIIRTPPAFRGEIQQALAGRPGTNGGAPRGPTEQLVADSRVGEENSNRTPAVNSPPIPRPRPQDAARTERDVVQDSGGDTTRARVADAAPGGDPGQPPAPPPPPPGTTLLAFGVATAGSVYETSDGRTISNPGAVGLVGGTDANDETVLLSQVDGESFASGSTAQGDLRLPIYVDSGFTTRQLSSADGALLGGVPLSGKAYTDVEGFAAYALAMNGDRTRPVYALTGTPTADVGVLRNNDVRSYAFSTDMLQEVAVPFMLADALATDYSGAAITPFYIAEEITGSDSSSRFLQSWLLIEGSGVSQISGIGVNVGDLFEDNGIYQSSFSRRGSFRPSSDATSFQMVGGIHTLGIGGNEVFGSNAQDIVLGVDFPINDDFGDPAAAGGVASNRFGTIHVLNLTGEAPIDQFAAAQGSGRELGGPGSVIAGYAAGVVEIERPNGSTEIFHAQSAVGAGGVEIRFDSANNSVAGEIEISNSSDLTHVAFGEGLPGNNANGRSALINDDLFGAAHNNSGSRTYVQQLDSNGNVLTNRRAVTGDSPKTYFVSGDAVPQPNLLPQGKMCQCSFLEWGWWGTQIRGANNSTPAQEAMREGIHLGTWVAGEVTTPAQLATLAGTSATYDGHALGNVTTTIGTLAAGTATYIAAGDMQMSYDFSSQSGSLVVSNFDGRNFQAPVNGVNYGTAASFGGRLGQTNGAQDASGVVDGSFVNNHAQVGAGVIGNFSVSTGSGTWAASGIIAGAR